MTPSPPLENPGTPEPEGDDPAPFTRLPDILRSWFWRYYDHLGRLLLYNIVWSVVWLPIVLFPILGAWFGSPEVPLAARWAVVGVSYLAAGAVSFPWAYLVFRLFVAGSASLREVPHAFRRYFLKAMGLVLLSAAVWGAGLLSVGFYLGWRGGMDPLAMGLTGIVVWVLLFWTGACLYQWPILFFQDPPFWRIVYRSLLLFMANSWTVLFLLAAGVGTAFMFTFVLKMFPWLLLGPVFFFSLQCMALEKHLLRYRITFGDAPLGEVLTRLHKERDRSWREFFKPWEAR